LGKLAQIIKAFLALLIKGCMCVHVDTLCLS
jgi:hypothetical protein